MDAVDGSTVSSPNNYDAAGYPRNSDRFTSPPRSTYLDDEIFASSRNEDVLYAAGTWMDDPPHGGRPQPTYGHNGLHHHATHIRTAGTQGLPLPSHRRDYEPDRYPRRPIDDGELSWSDELALRHRSQERHTAYSDTPRQRYAYPERPEYHESHEYVEHRDRHRRQHHDDYVYKEERRCHHRPRD